MRAALRHPTARRSALVTAATAATALVATGLLAGCAGGSGARTAEGAAAPAGNAAPVASTAAAPTPLSSAELTRGLLPASALGSGSSVGPVTLEQLQQRLTALPGGLTGALAGLHVEPAACAAAFQTVGASLTGVEGVAAEAAGSTAGGTGEALVSGAPADTAADAVRTVLRACPQVTVTSSKGHAAVTLSAVDLPSSVGGDDAAALQATAELTPAGGTPRTVSALLGVVQDSGRAVLLGTAVPGGTEPDVTSFTSLLEKAVDTESHALG
jgi:hypothetical protein